MRLNTRGRYGIQLMAQLACQSTDAGALGLKHVSAATGLPWRYLEQIARPLRQAGLVRGRAGRTGGYVLARQPEQITLRDVLEARRMLVEARLMFARAVAEQYEMLSELVLCCGLGDLEALQMLETKSEK